MGEPSAESLVRALEWLKAEDLCEGPLTVRSLARILDTIREEERERAVTAATVKTCPRCKGTGDDPVQGHPDHYFACDLCDGAKLVRVKEPAV